MAALVVLGLAHRRSRALVREFVQLRCRIDTVMPAHVDGKAEGQGHLAGNGDHTVSAVEDVILVARVGRI